MGYKDVLIKPFDYKGHVLANAHRVLQDFKHRGFASRKAFIEVVTSNSDKFTTYDELKQLEGFWHYRCTDYRIIQELENVLESLKAE